MSHEHAHGGERRFPGGAEKLRAPARLALMEVPRVVQLSLEGVEAKRLLDVGTGAGVLAEAFAARVASVTGVDPNLELLAAARAAVPGATFIEGTAEKLPFDDDSFDLVYLGQVLHEVDDPEAALREARRVATKRVAILEWPFRREEQGPPLEHRMQSSRIMDLARQAGFSAVERIELTRMDFYRLTP